MADGPPEGYVTAAEACRRLNISDRTLRRRVAAGTIDGEYLPRPQGSVLYVRLPEEAAMLTAPATDEAASGGTGGGTPPEDTAEAAPPPTNAPDATMRALDILEALLRANGETIERQAEQITRLHERVWHAERDKARAEALAESLAVARAQAKLEVDELREEVRDLKARPWWRKVWG